MYRRVILLLFLILFTSLTGCTSNPPKPSYVNDNLVNLTVLQRGDAVYIVEQGGPEFSNVSFFEFQLSAGWVYGEGVADYTPAIGKEILVGTRSGSPDRLIAIAVLDNGTREVVLDTYLRP